MSATASGIKGTLPVGEGTPSALVYGTLPPGTDGQAILADSTSAQGIKWVTPVVSFMDPRDVFRFSMIHNIGVGGG